MKRVSSDDKEKALVEFETARQNRNERKLPFGYDVDAVNYETTLLAVIEDIVTKNYDEAVQDILEVIDLNDPDVKEAFKKMGIEFDSKDI